MSMNPDFAFSYLRFSNIRHFAHILDRFIYRLKLCNIAQITVTSPEVSLYITDTPSSFTKNIHLLLIEFAKKISTIGKAFQFHIFWKCFC